MRTMKWVSARHKRGKAETRVKVKKRGETVLKCIFKLHAHLPTSTDCPHIKAHSPTTGGIHRYGGNLSGASFSDSITRDIGIAMCIVLRKPPTHRISTRDGAVSAAGMVGVTAAGNRR